MLGIGMASVPPCAPWGINFGGGLNSTAVILACIERGHRPDWILFADTGSEYPGTLEHVERMRRLVASPLLAMRKLTGGNTVNKKLLVIDDCNHCPHFDNEYYGFNGVCRKLYRKIDKGENYKFPIPDECPLQDAED